MSSTGGDRCADCPHDVGEHTPADEVPQMPCMACACVGFEERRSTKRARGPVERAVRWWAFHGPRT